MTPAYRCSACGNPRHKIVFQGDSEPAVLACPEHPESEVLEWPNRMQAALLYIEGLSRDMTIEELRGICEHETSLTVGIVLWERWGYLPERGRPHKNASPIGLFG